MFLVRRDCVDHFFLSCTVEEFLLFDSLAEILQVFPRVGFCFSQLQFQSIVICWVVACCDLNAAIQLAITNRKVIDWTRCLTDEIHMATGLQQPLSECCLKLRPMRASIAADS